MSPFSLAVRCRFRFGVPLLGDPNRSDPLRNRLRWVLVEPGPCCFSWHPLEDSRRLEVGVQVNRCRPPVKSPKHDLELTQPHVPDAAVLGVVLDRETEVDDLPAVCALRVRSGQGEDALDYPRPVIVRGDL